MSCVGTTGGWTFCQPPAVGFPLPLRRKAARPTTASAAITPGNILMDCFLCCAWLCLGPQRAFRLLVPGAKDRTSGLAVEGRDILETS